MDQLHSKYMGIEKIRLLACESTYWMDTNADIGTHIQMLNMS